MAPLILYPKHPRRQTHRRIARQHHLRALAISNLGLNNSVGLRRRSRYLRVGTQFHCGTIKPVQLHCGAPAEQGPATLRRMRSQFPGVPCLNVQTAHFRSAGRIAGQSKFLVVIPQELRAASRLDIARVSYSLAGSDPTEVHDTPPQTIDNDPAPQKPAARHACLLSEGRVARRLVRCQSGSIHRTCKSLSAIGDRTLVQSSTRLAFGELEVAVLSRRL